VLSQENKTARKILEKVFYWPRFSDIVEVGECEPKTEGEPGMDQKKVVIYDRSLCWHCWRTKRLFKRKGYQFEAVDLTHDSEGRAWLAEATGRRTVPQVFIDGHPVGGFAAIRDLDRSGELDLLVRGG
jgi:glutaredoxin 3